MLPKPFLDLHHPHHRALQFGCVRSSEGTHFSEAALKLLVDDEFHIDAVLCLDVRADLSNVIDLIVLGPLTTTLHDRCPKHVVPVVVGEILLGVLDITGELLSQLDNVVRPLVLDVLQPDVR